MINVGLFERSLSLCPSTIQICCCCGMESVQQVGKLSSRGVIIDVTAVDVVDSLLRVPGEILPR